MIPQSPQCNKRESVVLEYTDKHNYEYEVEEPDPGANQAAKQSLDKEMLDRKRWSQGTRSRFYSNRLLRTRQKRSEGVTVGADAVLSHCGLAGPYEVA